MSSESSTPSPQLGILRKNLIELLKTYEIFDTVDLVALAKRIEKIFHGYIRVRARSMLEALHQQLMESQRAGIKHIQWKKILETIRAQAVANDKLPSHAAQSFDWFKEELGSLLAIKHVLPKMNETDRQKVLGWMEAANKEDISLCTPSEGIKKVVGLALLDVLEQRSEQQ